MKSPNAASRLLAAGLLAAASNLAGSAPGREVTILYTNDFHSAIDPIPAYWRAGSPRLGGAAQIATLIGRIRAREKTTFLFDSGDLFTGTFSFLTKGEALMRLWDVLKVGVIGIIGMDARSVALLAPYREEAKKAAGAPAGTLAKRLVRDYRAESSLGDYVADVMRRKAGAEIAFQNAGGLRADVPAGPVTRANVLDALPFVNSLVTLDMTGKQIGDVLEQGLTLERGLVQVSGLTGTYDLGKPVGARLLSAEVGGRPLDDARTYRVATNSFLAQGGDLYATFPSATKVADGGVLLSDVVADALRGAGRAELPAGARLVPRPSARSALEGVETLSRGGRFDKYPSVAFDAAGDLWCAYTSTEGGNDRVVARRRKAGAWSDEQRLDDGGGLESGAKLILDGKRRLRIFWHGKRRGEWAVFSRTRAGSTWGPEKRISSNGIDALHPVGARDAAGRVWVAWEVLKKGGFAIDLVTEDGSRWSAPARITSDGTDRRPALAAPPDGGVWVAWDSTRTGNFDVFLARARAAGAAAPRVGAPVAVTADAAIDDSPSLACGKDGALWIAWNSMRGHSADEFRADRHSGDAFVRVYKDGVFSAPPGTAPAAQSGQVSFGMADKSLRDVEEPYWHWKQTQNYPSVFLDGAGRAWIVWRTDATGAHNFDLWARVHDGLRWSPEVHLTTFSPGRDEFPSAALSSDGSLVLAWEAQALPRPGEKTSGGDVDVYNTHSNPNVVLVGRLVPPADGWTPGEIAAVPPDHFDALPDLEPRAPGPEPRTATAGGGRWHIYFGDPHSHSILSDAKTGLPDQLLALSRDRLGFDFDVVSDHSEMGLLQPSEFAELRATAGAFDAPGRFVSLTGWEWTAGSAFGHRVLLYKDGGPDRALRSSDPESDTIEKLYQHARAHDALLSPHHTGNALWGRWNPAAAHDEALEPNFEIASWHGRYEFYGNLREGRRQVPGHQFQDALRLGRHVGVMGASDTHHLSPGEGGLTAVLAERLDRASIFEAIQNRRNYATTGARIVLEFTVDGAPMGSILTVSGPLKLAVRVEGTAPIDRVEIVRNLRDSFALIRMRQTPGVPDAEFLLYDPKQPQGGTWVGAKDARRVAFDVADTPDAAGETCWYVRVTQADGEQAWSSPVWAKR